MLPRAHETQELPLSEQTRQILTPGSPAPVEAAEAAAPVRNKPGPKPKAAAQPTLPDLPDDEDLGDTLPQAAAAPFSPEQQALVQQMISSAVHASRSSQDPGTAAKLAAGALESRRLPTQAAAIAMQEDQVAKGIRPRPILSDAGWVTHQEATRSPASLNGQAITSGS